MAGMVSVQPHSALHLAWGGGRGTLAQSELLATLESWMDGTCYSPNDIVPSCLAIQFHISCGRWPAGRIQDQDGIPYSDHMLILRKPLGSISPDL